MVKWNCKIAAKGKTDGRESGGDKTGPAHSAADASAIRSLC